MKNSRAQGWGFDLIIAIVIFLVGIMFFYVYTINYPMDDEDKFQSFREEGERVADSLLSEGNPSNWSAGDVSRIGLMSGGRIDGNKLGNFTQMSVTDYDSTRVLFRIKDNYFVYFGNDEADGIGARAGNAENVVRVTRVVVYNEEINSMNILIWG